ncbi:MAG: RluA family pseudouridine synthase [Gammaproteobacteria bacterium]
MQQSAMTDLSPETVGAYTKVRRVTVTNEHSGRRVDNYLLWLLGDVPKSRVYRMLRSGEVRIDGGRVRQDHRLRSGEVLRIPPVRHTVAAPPAIISDRLRGWLDGAILHEDDSMLIVNKPAGIAVHSGSGVKYGVIEILRALCPAAPYLELVHRLDRSTSGCLMVAKSPMRLRELHVMLRENRIEKRYLALSAGAWTGGPRRVETNLRRYGQRSGERVVRVCADGKLAETVVTPREHFGAATLVEAQPLTGRTHQIRVHLSHLGHPVAGDEKYGDRDFNKRMRVYGLNQGQLFLHARRLQWDEGEDGSTLSVEAPLPLELEAVLRQLRERSDVGSSSSETP